MPVSFPHRWKRPGDEGGPVALSYDIPADDHDDFFNAYTAALHDAFLDVVIEHPKLLTLVEEAFEESLEIYE